MESVRQAFRLLWAHKTRSALTLFGLVWGTAAVIFLVGWGAGMRTMVTNGFEKTGRNLGLMWAGRIGEDFTPAVDRRELWLNWEDMLAARRLARLPLAIGGEVRRYLPAASGQNVINREVRGVEPVGQKIRQLPLEAGRYINKADLDHRRRVAILGTKSRHKLLAAGRGLGSRIRIDGLSFEVVGFLAPVGTQFGRDGDEIDDQVWIPMTTHFAQWPNESTDDDVLTYVLFHLRDKSLMAETELELRSILAERIGVSPTDEEALRSWSPSKGLEIIPLDQQTGVLFALAATTLIVGGIGILNMMLDSVRQRRREIGIRLAVGARRRDILAQFFLETLTIVAFGGALGVALGVGGSLALASLDLPDIIPVPELSMRVIFLAVGTMSGVGLVAGVVPAWLASRIDPALTLRAD